MAALKILFFLVAVQVVYSKPFVFKELELKNNFELSLKPFLKPIFFIKEKWSPLGIYEVKHAVAKRSPLAVPPVSPEPPPAPLFNVALEKSVNFKSPLTPALHLNKEVEIKKEATPVSVLPPNPKLHEEIQHERFPITPKPHPEIHESKLHTHVDIHHSPVLPVETHFPPHIGISTVSPILLPPQELPGRLPGNKEGRLCPCPQSPPPPQVIAAHEHNLQILPKPKEVGDPHHALHAAIAGEGTFLGLPKSPEAIIQHEREPHLPEVNKLPPGIEHQGTLEGLLAAHKEETVPFTGVHPHRTPAEVPGQGTFPVLLKPPQEGIQSSSAPPRGTLLTNIARANDINAYLKAVDALPLVKPPLEENVLQVIPGNSLEAVGPKDLGVDNKVDTSSLARGSRLALYFGNILLQVMSQAIGSARSAFSQYSMPSTI